MKENFETPKVEVVDVQETDIICTSNPSSSMSCGGGSNETTLDWLNP